MSCCATGPAKMVTLNCGIGMPRLGFATVSPLKTKPEDGHIEVWVKNAVKVGFRYFDSAPMFRTKEEFESGYSQPEVELGKALNELMTTKNMKRKQFFIASTCGNTFHSKEKARECLEMTLRNMKLDFLDLYLIAAPSDVEDDKGVDYLETWAAMESFINEGLVRAIGVANFSLKQLQRLVENCRVKPAVLQIEACAFWVEKALISYAQKENIHVTAFSPFGAPERPWDTNDTPNRNTNETKPKIAPEPKRTGQQDLIRYCTEMGLSVVGRMTSPTNMEQNYKGIEFMLTEEQMQKLDKPLLSNADREIIASLVKSQERYDTAADEADRIEKINFGLKTSGDAVKKEFSIDDEGFSKMVRETVVIVQLIIEFSKCIPGFEDLEQSDQVHLLKRSTSELMILRTAKRYDPKRKAVVFSNNAAWTEENFLAGGMIHYVTPMFKLSHKLKAELQIDDAELALMGCISLFFERPESQKQLANPQAIEELCLKYTMLLQSYQLIRQPQRPFQFPKIMAEISTLQTVAAEHSRMLYSLHVNGKPLPGILSEEIWAADMSQQKSKIEAKPTCVLEYLQK